MTLLGPADPLPLSARRILITGASGAGKSTLRAEISNLLHVPTVEMDSLYHGPNWTVRPNFVAEVDQFTAAPAWAVEWQYTAVKPLLLSRSDLLVWLDHSRWTVMARVVRRTLRRRVLKQTLWNGNYEPPLRTFFTDPEHIVRWSWNTHQRRADEAQAVATTDDHPVVVRLAGQRDVEAWIRGPLSTLAERQRSQK